MSLDPREKLWRFHAKQREEKSIRKRFGVPEQTEDSQVFPLFSLVFYVSCFVIINTHVVFFTLQ